MSHTPERRRSTGGVPPVQVSQRCVVEKVPSHDSRPCFTAWTCTEIVAGKIPEGWSRSDFSVDNTRPQRSIQIYDTTPGADQFDRLKSLVETLHSETDEDRQLQDRGRPNRLDLWGFPLPSNTTLQERIEQCVAHMSAEIAWRSTTESLDFEISPLRSRGKWQRGLLIIDCPENLWNHEDGGFVALFWDVDESLLGTPAEGTNAGRKELKADRYTRNELESALYRFWERIR